MKSYTKNNRTANNIITVVLIIAIIGVIACIAGCSKKLDAENETTTYTVDCHQIDNFDAAMGTSLYYIRPTYTVFVGYGRTAVNLYYHGEPVYYNPDKQTFFVYTDTDILTVDNDVLFAEL